MQLKSGLKSSEFWLNVAAGLGTVAFQFLSANPNPAISLPIIALSAIYTVVRGYLKSKELDVAAATDAAAKVQAAVKAVTETKPEPLPAFGGLRPGEAGANGVVKP